LPLPSLCHLCVLHISLIQEKTGRIHTQAIIKLKEDYMKKEVNLNTNPGMRSPRQIMFYACNVLCLDCLCTACLMPSLCLIY
jgi:hypothetical protein